MNKMPWHEVKQIAEEHSNLSVGQKLRTNHNSTDCAGFSKSMIVEKKDDNSISIHCFRCGNTGWFAGNPTLKSLKERSEQHVTTKCNGRYFTFPRDSTTEIASWPVEARVWIRQARITDEEVEKYEISWSKTVGRVVIPVGLVRTGTDVTAVASFQTRRIYSGDTQPKYLSFRNRPAIFSIERKDTRTLCLVEDVLSCIRVGRIVSGMALQGVRLQPEHVNYIAKHGYDDFIIFLDDDNYQVKLAQLKISKQLSVFGNVKVIHNGGVDPKEMSDSALRSLLVS